MPMKDTAQAKAMAQTVTGWRRMDGFGAGAPVRGRAVVDVGGSWGVGRERVARSSGIGWGRPDRAERYGLSGSAVTSRSDRL
ncbi:hypothetical protein MUN77_02150 [Leucobacter allii]|uniref:hypothetical protein n=1 Tax=Leucobacter allii TaxID=2932247 RepID=UPI001FD28140|nr:hypothetical protein [Leucobacter allii]UOR03476.1 hypothetical protein MUN77_02150 [Leucobacter allii]